MLRRTSAIPISVISLGHAPSSKSPRNLRLWLAGFRDDLRNAAPRPEQHRLGLLALQGPEDVADV